MKYKCMTPNINKYGVVTTTGSLGSQAPGNGRGSHYALFGLVTPLIIAG